MKFSISTSAIAFALVLSGCTVDPMNRVVMPTQQATWQKAGITQDDTNSVIQKCRYDIGMANVSNEKENSLFNACMQSKGYRYM